MTFDEAKRHLVEGARERGVDVEVLGTNERRLSISADRGRVDELTHATQGGIGVRAVVDGKVGYASTERLDRDSLEWVLDEAIENAALQASVGAVMAPGRPLGRHDLLGEGLSAPVEAKVEGITALEAGLRADPRVDAIYMATYTESETEAVLGSTVGADGGYRNGYAYFAASPVMKQGDSVKQGWDFDFSKEFHRLDPTRTTQAILERVGRHLGATPLPTKRYRAYLEPEVTAAILSLLVYSLSGKTLAEGKSRLAGKLGERIASELVTIVDDPTLPDGPASRPFDAEGTPARRLEVVSQGVLRSFLHNSDTARRTGQENTGHAARSYASTLGVSPTNFVLETGDGFEMEDGLVITDLMGLHAGANPITGEASLQGLGLLLEGGEARPVDNFAISCNIFDLLLRVDGVGRESKWLPTAGMMRAPMLAIEWLSCAGS